MDKNEIIKTLRGIKGCEFATVLYRAKESGELARHTLLIGANLKKAYEWDLQRLKDHKQSLELANAPQTEAQAQALIELISSRAESLEKGIGNNSQYTQKGMWTELAPNARIDLNSGKIQLTAMRISKNVIEKGVFPSVNSREKTIAKRKLSEILKGSRFRSFSFEAENVLEIKIHGQRFSDIPVDCIEDLETARQDALVCI